MDASGVVKSCWHWMAVAGMGCKLIGPPWDWPGLESRNRVLWSLQSGAWGLGIQWGTPDIHLKHAAKWATLCALEKPPPR